MYTVTTKGASFNKYFNRFFHENKMRIPFTNPDGTSNQMLDVVYNKMPTNAKYDYWDKDPAKKVST